jgi:glutaredoxin
MNIKIYGKPDCSYCRLAKGYLDRKGYSYEYVSIVTSDDMEDLFETVSPHIKTVPVVVIDDVWIGGYTELQKYINEHMVHTNEGPKEILNG